MSLSKHAVMNIGKVTLYTYCIDNIQLYNVILEYTSIMYIHNVN